jgi:hypothetical protein
MFAKGSVEDCYVTHGWASMMDIVQWLGIHGYFCLYTFMKQEYSRSKKVPLADGRTGSRSLFASCRQRLISGDTSSICNLRSFKFYSLQRKKLCCCEIRSIL